MIRTTRREMILSASAAAVLGLSGPLVFMPSARAEEMRDKGFDKFKVGDIEVISIYDGIWQKPQDPNFIRNATVEETEAALAKAGLPTDFIPIEFAQTVVKSGDKTILIDAGTGGQLSPKAGMTMKNLAAAGVDPATIDTVLISHFHPDHIFGLMAKETNEQIFPNAEIVVPEAEFSFWADPSLIEKLPEGRRGLAQRIQATLPNWDNVRQISDGTEVAPGVRSVAAYGHTPGHTAYHVSSGNDELIVAADTANVPALFVVHPRWQAVFDADPQLATDTRIAMFDRAISDNSMIAGYHFGFPNAGTISKDGNGYVFQPVGG